MDNTGDLLVGSFSVSSADGADDEVLAVFRDDMLHARQAPAAEYEHMISWTARTSRPPCSGRQAA